MVDSENKQNATEKLYSCLSVLSVQKRLSKDLSNELDTELEVFKVYLGPEINKQDSTVQKQLSKDLSEELDTELEVDKVYEGSVMIELKIKDYTELENIKSLSDTGVLSNIFGILLLTAEYMTSCLADKVYIDATVDDTSYQDLMAYARG